MQPETRIYKVTQKTGQGDEIRLVRAPNRIAAERHVSKSTVSAELCGQEDLVLLLASGRGHKIIDCGEGPEEDKFSPDKP